MGSPIRSAFCSLFFAHNGGSFDANGKPIFSNEQIEVENLETGESDYVDPVPVRGKCSTVFDCGRCPLLTEWVNDKLAAGWSVGWECQQCLSETWLSEQPSVNPSIERLVPGYYQAGSPLDTPKDSLAYDEDRPQLEGCTRCGYATSFLQLIIRRP